MKILGLHHPDTSQGFLQEMIKLGFNGYSLNPNWDATVAKYSGLSYEELQVLCAQDMYKRYTELKAMGFKYFLMGGAGWGLGEVDQNWAFKRFAEPFKDCDDVLWSVGEFYEDWVETGKISEENYNKIMKEKRDFFSPRFEQGNTRRNKLRFNSDSLTSYEFQQKYWRSTDKFVWIFGQPGWHNIIGSLWYSRKNKFCKNNNITIAYLYQGNQPEWTAIGWEAKIFSLLRIKEWFERIQRTRFIKHFKG